MEFTHETSNALERYFSVLSYTGYKSYDKVYNLLVMVFIEEMLCGPMSEYITEEDYNTIHRSMNCLYGDCMIPFPAYKKGIDDKTFGRPYSCRLKNKS